MIPLGEVLAGDRDINRIRILLARDGWVCRADQAGSAIPEETWRVARATFPMVAET
jgi:hypothetical protein